MIELERVYSFEECSKLTGRDEYYFRRRVNEHQIHGVQDATRPWMKAIMGKDLVRHLQSVQWGQKLLSKWKIDSVHEDLFIDRDRLELEEKLKHLLEVKEQRVRALHITMCKIDEVKEQLEELNKKKGAKQNERRGTTKDTQSHN